VDAEHLDDSLLEEIEAHAINIAEQAGQIVRGQFCKPVDVQFKDDKNNDPVTTADHLSEQCLKRAIGEKYPQHGILSEEGGALQESDSPFVWVLDPLDGTSNFMNGLPLFAVSVGVLWKKQPVVGSIYVPFSHQAAEGVYHARLGKGAFLNSEKIGVSKQPSLHPLSAVPVQFRSRFRLSGKSRKKPHDARNLGSIAVELALVAGGIFQFALFGAPKLWDVAAGVLLVREAGGLSFIKRPGGKNWQVLEQFEVKKDNNSNAMEKLSGWSFPLLVGTPDTAGAMVRDIQIRHSPLSSLATRFWPRRDHRPQSAGR
jgi:myo-inositol-1(or 4)-monophosphatase